jgi:hypothetical protein
MSRLPDPPRLPSQLIEELGDTEWHWINGSKHWKLYVKGRFCAIWPHSRNGASTRRGVIMTRNAIRKALRGEQ